MLAPVVALTRIILTGIAFLYFWIGAGALSWVILPVLRRCLPDRWQRARRCQAAVQRGFRIFHGYMHRVRLIDYDPRRVRPLPVQGPFVMVANHPSLVDVTAIASAYGPLCVVAKHQLFRSPLVGRLLGYCEHVDGGDGSPLSGVSVMEESLLRLKAGLPVLIFPEGTRSPAGAASLRKFKRGAFEIACRAQVPILPVLVRLDSPILLKTQRWYQSAERQRVRMTVEPLAPIPVSELSAGVSALTKRVEALFCSQLQIDPTTLAPGPASDPTDTAIARPRKAHG